MNGCSGNLNETSHGEPVLSELKQYIATVALIIAILLAFSVAVYLVSKLRGKK
jgi:hypothetical protein